MKKREGTPKARGKASKKKPMRTTLVVGVLLVAAVIWGVISFQKRGAVEKDRYQVRPRGSVTFTKDISPIIFKNCAGCHRPGQSAPFNLITYEDVKKHQTQIAEVTANRLMPPWLPDPRSVHFQDERVLTTDEIGLIGQWVSEGAVEGAPTDLPPTPKWDDDWQLGKPDLVITMPEPFSVPAEGKDVYRNFVIPIPMTKPRYVEAVDFRPGNPKVVHHSAMRLDQTGTSRRLDALENGPGFQGMTLPEATEVPDGHFLNWQPGKLPYRAPKGLAWLLKPGTDFVVQLHLHPSGKEETVQSSVGFYFTDTPPTNTPFKLVLDSSLIDIAPGQTAYKVTDTYRLPVEAQALVVFPHAHYLARQMKAFATLPDGKNQWLLDIPEWNFNWQGDYRYQTPILLPKGTLLTMEFIYDNSTNNVRNPNHPPKRVVFGPESTDEMGELWLQLLTRSKEEFLALSRDYNQKQVQKVIVRNESLVRSNPNNASAHLQLGKAKLSQGNAREAENHFMSAVQVDPQNGEGHYLLGVLFRMQNRLPEAMVSLQKALSLNPENFKIHGTLGMIALNRGDFPVAEHHFQEALRLNPGDTLAAEGLADALKGQGLRKR